MDAGTIRWLTVYNDSGEDIPAFGIMQIVEVNYDESIKVDKPSEDSTKLFLINGGSIIKAGDQGAAYAPMEMPYWVYYDTADGTPVTGEQWGPGNGTWKAKKGKIGLLMVEMVSEDVRPITGVAPAILEVCRP